MRKSGTIILLLILFLFGFQLAKAGDIQPYYVVNYDNNCHGTVPDSRIKWPGKDFILSDRVPNCIGYIFSGWATSPDAEEPEYYPSDTYSVDADVTLYAVWKEEDLGQINDGSLFEFPRYPIDRQNLYYSFAVSESGTYCIHTIDETYNSQYLYGVTAPVLYEYTSEWKQVSVGTLLREDSLSSIAIDAKLIARLEIGKKYLISFMAPWKPVKFTFENKSSDYYKISYNNNGHGSVPVSSFKEKGTDFVLSEKIPDCVGYIFSGWATSPVAEEPEYYPSDTYSVDADVILYAVWKEEDLGLINDNSLFEFPRYPINRQNLYYSFTVSESGTYRIHTIDETYNSQYLYYVNAPILYEYTSECKQVTIGTLIKEDSSSSTYLDAELVAELKSGKKYIIEFMAPWKPLKFTFNLRKEIPIETNIILPLGSTRIENQAFYKTAIESVTIPASVLEICDEAFANCTKLRLVVIHSSDIAISDSAFSNCSNLLIVAPAGSTARDFAYDHNYAFVVLTQD